MIRYNGHVIRRTFPKGAYVFKLMVFKETIGWEIRVHTITGVTKENREEKEQQAKDWVDKK